MQPPRGARTRLRSQQGSLLLLAYFVVSSMLGLIVSQTFRAMSMLQVESRSVSQTQLWALTEGALDYAHFFIATNPDFGHADSIVAACSDQADWDCVPQPTPTSGWLSLGTSSLGSFMMRAKSEPGYPTSIIGGRKTDRRRVRVIGRLPSGQLEAQEIMLETVRSFAGGVVAKTRINIGQNSDVWTPMKVYQGGPNAVRLNFGTVAGSYTDVFNKITTGSTTNLCCKKDNPGQATIAIEGNAFIRHSNDTDIIAEDTWGLNTAYAGDANYPVSDPSLSVAELQPVAGCSLPNANPDIPIGATWRFCKEGGSCMNGTYNGAIGREQPDGSVLYCFQAFKVGQNGTAEFHGNNAKPVDVISMGQVGTTGDAYHLGPNSVTHSCPVSGSCADFLAPHIPPLTLHVPSGNPYGLHLWQHARIYGTVDVLNGTVVIGNATEVFLDGALIADYLDLNQGARLRDFTGATDVSLGPPKPRVLAWRRCQSASGASLCNP